MMFTVPECPIIADWIALKDNDKEEDNTKHASNNKGAVQYTMHGSTDKDPQVKEKNRDLEHGDVREVHYLHDIEELHKVRYHAVLKRPNVSSEAMGNQALCIHYCTRDRCEEGHDDEPIIKPKFCFGDEDFEI